MSRIMIVDDDPDILRLVKTGLSKAGFKVIEAESADVALAKIAEEKPDLLITDAMMPGKDGYELCLELRRRPETASLPIIMLTALQQEHDALKAFQDGVDDFITKPFSMPVLRARVSALLSRARAFSETQIVIPPPPTEPAPAGRLLTGLPNLDVALNGGIPRGSNILVMGETGAGKSTLSRRFLATGLMQNERCMVITIDDDPALTRISLGKLLPEPLNEYEHKGYFRLVDSYSWSRGLAKGSEKFAVSGAMELNQLASVISDAGQELGQNVADKLGGRRVIDSVSSLFITFELPSIQRFLAQLARTASSYGGVSTLFILEEGSVSNNILNNIIYLMDVVLQLKFEDHFLIRVANMKWSKFSREWLTIDES